MRLLSMNVMFGIDLLPFQGSVFLIAVTQGVALGYHLSARWADRKAPKICLGLYFFSKSPDFNPGPQFLHERTNVCKVFPLDVRHHCVF